MRPLSELLKDRPITVRVEFFAASHGQLLLSVEGLFPAGDTRLVGIAASELTFVTEPQRGTAVLEPVRDGFRLTIGPFSATAIGFVCFHDRERVAEATPPDSEFLGGGLLVKG